MSAAVLAVLTLAGAACGEGGDSAAAVEERVARERAEAAKLARQEERIKQLERERRRTSRRPTRVVTVPVPSSQASPSEDGATSPSGVIAQLGSFRTIEAAESHAAGLRARGIDAAVLRSDDYRELRAGWWVSYAGPFDGYGAANRVVRQSGASGAKARAVTPIAER